MQFFWEKDVSKLEKYLGVKKTPGKHEKKLWEKVWKYSYIFSKIPGILCICVWNSLPMNAAHKDSDIDLFIITRNNRIWTVRIVFTLFLALLWERKNEKNHAWKFCLSFFITESALDFDAIAIKNDIYLSYWIQSLKPIINREKTYERFMHINFPSQYEKPAHQNSSKVFFLSRFFWNMLENICKFIFLPKTQKSFQKLWKPFGVIISDDMLKFHDADRRKEIRSAIISS